MRRILLLLFWQFGLLAAGRLFADVVTLKDGRQISGVVESGNTQELHLKVGDQSQTIDIHEVQAIQFGVSLPAPAAPPPAPKAAAFSPGPAPAAMSLIFNAVVGAAIGIASIGCVAIRAVVGKLIGEGREIAPETRSTNTLTQPAFMNSKRGRQ